LVIKNSIGGGYVLQLKPPIAAPSMQVDIQSSSEDQPKPRERGFWQSGRGGWTVQVVELVLNQLPHNSVDCCYRSRQDFWTTRLDDPNLSEVSEKALENSAQEVRM
jgi:hypothetical protein